MYTVKQLAQLAGVSVRTLHYYDEIGLLEPSFVGDNSYRYYDEPDLFRLQQILFFRELEVDLLTIKRLLHQPDFDLVATLRNHQHQLQHKIARLHTLVATIDHTIRYLNGVEIMNQHQIFAGFSEEQEQAYAEQASQKYDPTIVRQSMKRWKGYSAQQQQQIKQEGQQIYQAIVADMAHGPASPVIQAHLARWQQHLEHFYQPTTEMLRGLGQMYADDPAFAANLAGLHPDLPVFLQQAINIYVDRLEQP